jgi:hypothetical protein
MNSLDLIRKFHSTLPTVREWIEETLEENKNHAVPVIDLAFPRLEKVFSLDLLSKAKVVVVTGKVPFPPLSRMGLPELGQMENMSMDGITYVDTFFINHLHQTESLHFHELVHVVQWERLGVDNFLLAYGIGLMQFGYQNSPLEQMAYSLQDGFDRGTLDVGVIELIRQRTDAIWSGVASLISKV